MSSNKTIQVDNDRLEAAVERAIDAFSNAVREYAQSFSQMDGTGAVPGIFSVENFWEKLTDEARESMAHLVEDSIESINERTLIESKKGNT